MDCRKAEELLSFYVHDELEPSEAAPVQKHLQVCGGCTRKLEEFRVVRDALKSLPALEVPIDFLPKVRARIAEPVTLGERLEPFLATLFGRRFVAGASMAALVGIAWQSGAFMGHDLGVSRRLEDAVPAGVAMAPPGERVALASGEGAPAREPAVVADEAGAAGEPVPSASEMQAEIARAAEVRAQLATLREAEKSLSEPVRRDPVPAPVETAAVAKRDAAEGFDADFGSVRERRSGRAAPEAASAASSNQAPPAASRSMVPPADLSPFLVTEAKDANKKSEGSVRSLKSEVAALPAAGPVPSQGAVRSPVTLADKESARVAAVPTQARKAASRATDDLAGMDADGLAEELDRLVPSGGAPGTLSIFDPGGDALARLSPSAVSGGGAVARSRSPVAEAPAPPPAPASGAAAIPKVAWLRSQFGRRVEVRSQGGERDSGVAREVEIKPRDAMGYLTGIRNLVEAGWGLELKKVIAWQESEVEVLVSFGSGAQAEGLLAQFVSDLRTLSGGDVVSDVALDRGSGPVLLRITIPNRGAEPTVAVR